MKRHDQLRELVNQTRPHWDRDETRPAVRSAFAKALQCRTLELGAEVFASDNEEQVHCHTCKSRPCSSCGYRSTVQWQRERWAALPDVPYKGITFTMPDVLWPLFRDNPHLTNALSALAARIIQIRASTRSGLRVGVMAILHTFNGKLEFNSHVHTMVTAGGLYGLSDTWIPTVYYQRDRLLESWRKAVIRLLRFALLAGQLISALKADEIEALLNQQEKRWWSVKVQNFKSKAHFLKYAGRYLRRPPIAQRRIIHVGDRTVRFWHMDKKLSRKVDVQCSPEEFIDRWSQHIPERYRHAVRNFGLFSPRATRQTYDAIFALLGHQRSPRPTRRPWAESIRRDFGRDPLLDSKGKRMVWVGRIAPRSSQL
jgi:Putative transposase/Transposase zinc-binding domain